MGMGRTGVALLCVVGGVVAAGSARGEVVLGSFTGDAAFGAGLTSDSIRLFVTYRGDGATFVSPVGDQHQLFGSMTQQVIEYRSTADDPDYDDFIARLTNGEDEILGHFIMFWDRSVGAGNSTQTEAELFGRSSDFAGYTITGLRLTVDPFVVEQHGMFTNVESPSGDYDVPYTWEVLGTIPEPASLLLFAGAAPLLIRRRGIGG